MALNPDQPLYLPTDGGVAATHPEVPMPPGFVGPATENQLNTFRARLIPFACWKVDNIRFDFDSSFVKPEITGELETLRQLRARHPGAVLSIFGHTEPPSPAPPPVGPKRYKLHIRRTDSIWPVKMAEICTGNANRYKELEQVPENKRFLKPNGQWRDLYAEDEIYLPDDWVEKEDAVAKLEAKKYLVKEALETGETTTASVRDDEYCKAISGRRAAAIYALLTRRTDIWEDIYSNAGKYTSVVKGDPWGAPVLEIMLATLGRHDETASYEQSAGKRSELFRAYMDKLCGSAANRFKLVIGSKDSIWPAKLAEICTGDATRYKELEPFNEHLMKAPGQWRELRAKDEIHLPPNWGREQRESARKHYTIEPRENGSSEGTDGLELAKEDFLARGQDPHGKGDYQGCGAFNPLLPLGEIERDENTQSGHGPESVNAVNRRVVVLLFRPGSEASPLIWPCPRAREKADGCRRRFWVKGEQRRSIPLPDERRKFEERNDAVACRFYDRMSKNSPCNKVLRVFRIRLYDRTRKFIASAPCRLTIGGKTLPPVHADPAGYVAVREVEVPNRCVVEWGHAENVGHSDALQLYPYRLELFLEIDDDTKEQEAAGLLNNIGYASGASLEQNITAFQADYGRQFGLQVTGRLDDDDNTLNAMRKVHDSFADDLMTTTPHT